MSGSTVPGTFQHYIVSFTRYLTPIPEGVDMAEAAPVLCESLPDDPLGRSRYINRCQAHADCHQAPE
jgi:hypothetical protein